MKLGQMQSIGFCGAGRYTAALVEGMFGAQWPDAGVSSDIDIKLFDIDTDRTLSLKSQLRASCEISVSCDTLLAESDLVILGVPIDQVGTVISQAATSRRTSGRPAGVLLMDGVAVGPVEEAFPDLPLGAMMYNFLVKYRSGIVGLWPGTLLHQNVSLLRNHLPVLGSFWLTEDLIFLDVIRATAGVGVGIFTELLSGVSEGMKAAGLDDEKAALVIDSIVKGCATHLTAGGTIDSLSAAVPSPNSPVATKAIQRIRDRMHGEDEFLRRVFEDTLAAYRMVR